jgi:hypothetical protein
VMPVMLTLPPLQDSSSKGGENGRTPPTGQAHQHTGRAPHLTWMPESLSGGRGASTSGLST